MARASYNLNKLKTITLQSSNGTDYTAFIWTSYSGTTSEWILDSNGLILNWESAESQDKNSPILASKLNLKVIVEDASQELEIKTMAESSEKDVWITLRKGTTGTLLWSGYLIPNLDSREDVSYPYVSTLVFVDGIANLKETPFIRETNSISGLAPTFPYTKTDTFAQDGYRTIIGATGSWITEIIDDIGMVRAIDEVVPSAGLENYQIQTAVNWWNEDMNVGPQLQYCPLSQTRINVSDFYKVSENNQYTPPNTYSILKSICKTFNMRFFFWENTFHFIQISEYNTDEQSTAPFTAPVNIPTRKFLYTGVAYSQHNYFGSEDFSLYKQVIETGTADGGLQKLATTNYESLPAIKKTNTTFSELAGGNHFNGFPLFLTHNTIQTPTAWPNDGYYHHITQFSQSIWGEYNIMTLTDADQLGGFVCRIFLTFQNTSNANVRMQTLWTMRAKPSGSAWGDNDNKTMHKYSLGSYVDLRWMSITAGPGQFPLSNNQEYVRKNVAIPANCSNYNINIFDSSTADETNQIGNLFPTDPSFSGSWDFQFYTFTEYDSDNTYRMRAYHQGNSDYSHGRVLYSAQVNAGTTINGISPMAAEQAPTYYGVDYVDTIIPVATGGSLFESLFVPVQTGGITFGNTGQEIEVEQSGNDAFEYDVGTIAFGDGSGADTNSTFQVYDGSDWVYVDPLGKWAKGIYTWNGSAYVWSSLTYDKKSQILIGEQIMNNQSKTILTFNGTTALSSNDKYCSGSTKLKFMNPCARMEDYDGKKYMMMRSSFNLIDDEWNGQWVEVYYQVPTTVTTGTGTTSVINS